MDFVLDIVGLGTSLFSYLIPFVFVLTVVVFFHELGHFAVARYFGTRIDVFSIGFGREIFGWYDRHGTRWRVSWIPLGGYIKFFGDAGASSAPDREALQKQAEQLSEEERKACFHFKPLGQRAAIVAAGPIANFILAIVILAFIFGTFGEVVLTPRIDSIRPGGAAEQAGLQVGDVIVKVDGKTIATFSDLQRVVSISAETPLLITVNRFNQLFDLTVTPERGEITDRFGNVHKVGLLGIERNMAPEDVERVRYGPLAAIGKGVTETWFVIERTFVYLGRIIVGKEEANQLGGPLRIAQISGQVASLGFVPLINLTAILSVSIGLINLFPIPMLDGGHLLYYGYEAIAGRPLNARAQEYGFRIGLALVLCLMVFATWNDLVQLAIFNGLFGTLY
ncbi:MAG: RIP metalloprotease RseP [Alphaproteobacteria bacterium]|nr:MAG: RIP metalloprotease RseP [Alphaproteobacteria bacterium]